MIADFWRKTGQHVSRRTAATLMVVVVVTVGLGIGLRRLDFSTGQNSYIDPASQVAKDNERYQGLFGGENKNGYLNTFWSYDSAADQWTPQPSAPLARSHHTAVVGSKLIPVWGGASPIGLLNTGGVFDTSLVP